MIKTCILTGLMAILTACSTLGNTEAHFTLKDGHVAKFVAGDCAKISPDSPFAKRSDGTPVQIIFVDEKYSGYITYMDHPKMGGPNVVGAYIKKFDRHWIVVDCKEDTADSSTSSWPTQITGVN